MANDLDALFGALADPTRRAVIEALMDGPTAVSDLYSTHDMALPTFLRHLKVLEAGGLITSIKSGRVRTVSWRPETLADAADWLNRHKAIWERRMDRLGQRAAHMHKTQS